MSHEQPYSKWFDSFIAFVHLYAVHLTRIVVGGGGDGGGWFFALLHLITRQYKTYLQQHSHNKNYLKNRK